MNYAGFDIYAHNRATRRFSRNTRADLVSAQPIDCPFCGRTTTTSEGAHSPAHRAHGLYHVPRQRRAAVHRSRAGRNVDGRLSTAVRGRVG